MKALPAALAAALLAALALPAAAQIASVDPRVAEGRALLEQKKVQEAGDLFKAACDKKVGEGCYYQAIAVRDYRYAPATLEEHYALKEKACSLKFGQACFSLAIDYRSGSQGITIDKAKGNGFMEKSCQLGWGAGCSARATDFQYGFNDTAKDETKAFEFFRKGCKAQRPNAGACKELALLYAAGTGTEENLDLAVEAIKKAAELSPDDFEIHKTASLLTEARDRAAK